MSLKSKETRKNKDGSYTTKTRFTDGSGNDKKWKWGTFGKKTESVKRISGR